MDYTIDGIRQDIDQLLQQSISLYQEIGAIYHNLLQTSLNTASAGKLTEDSHRVEGYLVDASEVDTQIQELQRQGNYLKTESTTALLAQREMAIAELVGTNKTIAKKAQNTASMLRHECSTMAKNHSAIAGYGNSGTAKRSIFKGSF